MTNRQIRVPLQVSFSFKKRLEELQKKIMRTMGEKKSYYYLTEELAKTNSIDDLGKRILNKGHESDKLDINIKLDRRLFG